MFLILKTKNYIFPILIAVAVILSAWLFSSVLIYLVISLVLFLIGNPLSNVIQKFKIGGKRINSGIAALATLIIMFSVFYLFFILILPPLIQQVSFMSDLNFYDVLHGILDQYPSFKYMFSQLGTEETMKATINEQFNSVFNFGNVSAILNNLISYLSGFIGGLFCVLFITFFLLKDQYTAS